jgi:hypothetical protein
MEHTLQSHSVRGAESDILTEAANPAWGALQASVGRASQPGDRALDHFLMATSSSPAAVSSGAIDAFGGGAGVGHSTARKALAVLSATRDDPG